MEDITLTQLFARMDAHLAQQDAYLREAQAERRKLEERLTRQDLRTDELLEGLRRSNELLVTTAKEVAAIHREAARQHAENRLTFEALMARLEGDPWRAKRGGGHDDL